MRKSVQLAKAQIGVYEFKVIKKKTSEYEAEFLLYREWGEWTPVGVKKHKSLDGKYEFYATYWWPEAPDKGIYLKVGD